MRYDVNADVYEGPLSLLVELCKLNLIDLFLIRLVDLTQAYLDTVKKSGIDPSTRPAQRGLLGIAPSEQSELAEPLPLLGNLMAIKARLLLPAPPVVEEEEVPISLEELERRLKEYEQFKTVAQLLAELHALQHQHFARPRTAAEGAEVPAAAETASAAAPGGPLEVGIADLMSAFAKVLSKTTAPVYEVAAEPWTVEMKVEELRVLLTVRRQLCFSELFSPQKSALELVVTFLALLELMRQRVARALQEQPFAEIVLTLSGDVSIFPAVSAGEK
jgi:segregation and condensation protein A